MFSLLSILFFSFFIFISFYEHPIKYIPNTTNNTPPTCMKFIVSEKYKYPAINNNAVSKPAMIVRMFPIGFFVDMLYIQNALPKKKNNPAIIALIILGVVIIIFVFIISFSGIIFKNVNINKDDTPNVKQKNNHVDM